MYLSILLLNSNYSNVYNINVIINYNTNLLYIALDRLLKNCSPLLIPNYMKIFVVSNIIHGGYEFIVKLIMN